MRKRDRPQAKSFARTTQTTGLIAGVDAAFRPKCCSEVLLGSWKPCEKNWKSDGIHTHTIGTINSSEEATWRIGHDFRLEVWPNV